MTARDMLDRRVLWTGGTMYAGMAIFLAGIIMGAVLGQQPVLAISLPGFAVAFVVVIVAHFFALRCPRCRGNLAPLIMARGCFSVDPRLCFCPYCGVPFDEELT